MRDWNVVISVHEGGYRDACQLLEQFGEVSHTHFCNVLVAKVVDPRRLIETLTEWTVTYPDVPTFLARVMPATVTFNFDSPEQFEKLAREAVLGRSSELAGKRFHVRLHRRGFKGQLSSPEEERQLDAALLEALEKAGTPGAITFDDPDAILAIETVDNRAGLSLWTCEDLRRFPLLRLD